jgi:hypothetical protein
MKGIPLTAQSEPFYSVGTPEVCFQPEEPKVFLRPLANSRLASSGRADEQSDRHAVRLHRNAVARGKSRYYGKSAHGIAVVNKPLQLSQAEERPVFAFDQIGTPSIRKLKAGVDDVPRRDTARERGLQDLEVAHFLLSGPTSGGLVSTSPVDCGKVYEAIERHASLVNTGLYFVGTFCFSSSCQGRTTEPMFMAFRALQALIAS